MSKPHKKIRLGIVGCGKGSEQRHLPALQGVAGIRVVAAADINADNLKRVGDRFGIEHRFPDHQELLNHSEVEAVAVLTPTPSHAEIALAALEAGKHLFIDKPLATNLAECDQLIERAADSTAKVLVGFNFRWHRLIRRAREMIRKGAVGKIKAIRSVYTHWHPGDTAQAWHKKRELGGGVIFNDGVHHYDLWRFLVPGEVIQLYAQSVPSEHYEDETCTINARMANDALACGLHSYETSANSELEVFGESGRLYVSCYRFDGLEFFSHLTYPGSLSDRMRKLSHSLRELPRAIPVIRQGGYYNATFRAMWQHFADCICQGQSPGCTLEDGKRAVQIALAAIESASSGNVVHLRQNI